MKFLVIFIVAFLATANGRFVQDELVPTRWMDRVIPDDANERIFGGEPAEIADFPYMIAYLDLTRGGFRCGSSAIASHWVLTAAHCLEIMTPVNQLQLRGGSTLRNTGGVLFNVQAYWMHPSYNARLEYDIGLVRTPDNSPIVGTNIAFIPLPPICPDTQVCCDVCAGVSLLVSGKFLGIFFVF
ncbi:trypsin theta-like [Chironomus tepperi]|uniref:trypsin theta-like n=1 Tax=Chironomus tepperi TaxID=113505 RepID=UPI00391FC633